MELLAQYGLFLLKAITVVIASLVIVGAIFNSRRKSENGLEITSLNQEFQKIKKHMHHTVFNKKIKNKKNKDKVKKDCVFVLDFIGDIKASSVESLRREISAILSIASPQDEVVLRLESPGGTVNGYGLAASQLQRIRDKNIPLTVCIDKVAASGGYLMACVANRVVAAPFAIVGSIGVVAQLPNFHRFLKKHNIDFEQITAGDYKRTLTVFGENSEKGRKKFKEDLELIHKRFGEYILDHRNTVDLEQIATGEHWLARDAFELSLVDKLKTSDDYIIEKLETHNIYHVEIEKKVSLSEKLFKQAAKLSNPWA